MTTKTNLEAVSSNRDDAVASEATNVRPEPISLHVRTALKAGISIVQTIGKSTPS